MDQGIPACVEVGNSSLDDLLNRVEHGETLMLSRNGRPVARLAPVASHDPVRAAEALERLFEFRERLRAQYGTVSVQEILASRHEGHRY